MPFMLLAWSVVKPREVIMDIGAKKLINFFAPMSLMTCSVSPASRVKALQVMQLQGS